MNQRKADLRVLVFFFLLCYLRYHPPFFSKMFAPAKARFPRLGFAYKILIVQYILLICAMYIYTRGRWIWEGI